MASGMLPFNASSEYILFQKIKDVQYTWPEVKHLLSFFALLTLFCFHIQRKWMKILKTSYLSFS